jgi:hypothetical protein
VHDWEAMRQAAPVGWSVVQAAPEKWVNLIGKHLMYRQDDEVESIWVSGVVASVASSRSLKYGWNFKVEFAHGMCNCLLVTETYGASDDSRWCLLKRA